MTESCSKHCGSCEIVESSIELLLGVLTIFPGLRKLLCSTMIFRKKLSKLKRCVELSTDGALATTQTSKRNIGPEADVDERQHFHIVNRVLKQIDVRQHEQRHSLTVNI